MQGAQAIKQANLAKNLKQSDYIPPSILEAEQRSRAMANSSEVPGEAAAKARLDRQTANTTNAVRTATKDSGTVLEKLQEADAVAKAKATDIEAQAQEFRYRNQKALDQTLQAKAAYEQKNRDAYDSAKSALRGASNQNAFNAANNATAAAMMMDPSTIKSQTTPAVTAPSKRSDATFSAPEVLNPEQTMMEIATGKSKKPTYMRTPHYREPAPVVEPFGFMGIN